jgi:hypothetical protein
MQKIWFITESQEIFLFSMTKEKLLGHIVSKDGVKIDVERVQAI